jgi:hypothetical protein
MTPVTALVHRSKQLNMNYDQYLKHPATLFAVEQ